MVLNTLNHLILVLYRYLKLLLNMILNILNYLILVLYIYNKYGRYDRQLILKNDINDGKLFFFIIYILTFKLLLLT